MPDFPYIELIDKDVQSNYNIKPPEGRTCASLANAASTQKYVISCINNEIVVRRDVSSVEGKPDPDNDGMCMVTITKTIEDLHTGKYCKNDGDIPPFKSGEEQLKLESEWEKNKQIIKEREDKKKAEEERQRQH